MFGVYVALFGASLFGVIGAAQSISLAALRAAITPRLPRKTLGRFLAGTGFFTAVMWISPIAVGLTSGQPPELLDHATTLVTEALDLAVVVPAALVAAWMLLRSRVEVGVLLAIPLLTLLVALAPTIGAQTVSQIEAGIRYTAAEIAGPIAGFLVLGVVGATLMVRLFSSLDREGHRTVGLPGQSSVRTPDSWT